MSKPGSFIIISLSVIIIALAPVQGDDKGVSAPSSATETPLRLAVLPLVNYSGASEAMLVFLPLINERLSRGGFVLIDSGAIDNELRRRRIRSTAAVGREDAAALGKTLGIDFFLLGSIDVYLDGSNPEAAVSFRVVDPGDMSILWAESIAACGQDFAKLLGVGRITSMDELARQIIDKSLANLNVSTLSFLSEDPSRQIGPLHVPVVFDNLSKNNSAGDIVTAIVISEMAGHRIRVLEPGVALELFHRNGQFPKGELDLFLLRQLYDQLGIERVITGTVDIFQPAAAGGEATTPEVALGSRCLDAATGKILAAAEIDRRGTDSESIFGLGITCSQGKVARDALHLLMEKINVFEK